VKVRFLADADFNKAIVTGVLRREPSIDFLAAQAAGLHGMKDPEVLALAAAQQWLLVSHDAITIPQVQERRKPERRRIPHCTNARHWNGD
jgi:predicted nuclease of predicted toxin-antitoxin system